jgi:hypothetical protein
MVSGQATQDAATQQDWLAILEVYDVRFLVLDVEQDVDLLQRASLDPGWAVDFQDTDAVLMARAGARD